MIYLILSILSSVGIFLAFRLFKTFHVHTRKGIMMNYLVAGVLGVALFQPEWNWWSKPWFLPSCLLGVLFYVVFRVMARVTQENGLAVSSIATKMSVVIPVAVGLTVLDESLNALKLVGIALGLISVVLSSGDHVKAGSWVWPMLLFLGSGVVDSNLKLFQHYLVSDSEIPVFSSNIFLSAFVASFIHHLFLPERRIQLKEVIGGTGLGLVNIAALYFILRSLALPNWESSVVFPINNFGIIAGSTLLAILFFKEKIHLKGWLGIAFALASITLLYLAK
jgi:drug/metabolite transporter (DMT)-like permease